MEDAALFEEETLLPDYDVLDDEMLQSLTILDL